MANIFAITITGINQATASVRTINNAFSQLTQPITQVGQSLKALGRELGLDKVAQSLGSVASNARGAAAQVGKIGAPLLSLVGGDSKAGIATLSVQWARLGSEVARTSRTIGVSTGDLQSLRGVAQVLGVSSDELTGGMKAMGSTMQDATQGRNKDALAMMNKLGIGIHKTADGAIDSTRAFRDLSTSISQIKSPQVQGSVARTFGVEALLPILREGPGAIAKYQQKVNELGGVMGPEQIRRAEGFGMALNYLSIAGQGLRNTIGDALIPAFQPLIEELTMFIAKNRELIGKKVGEWAQQLATWIRSIKWQELWTGVEGAVQRIASFVDAIGGWKAVAVGVGLVMAGPLLLSIAGVGLKLGLLTANTIPLAIEGLALLVESFGGAEAIAGSFSKALRGIGVAGGVAFAGVAGWEFGTWLNKTFVEGTALGDKLGQSIAKVLALLGVKEAQDAVAAEKKHNEAQLIEAGRVTSAGGSANNPIVNAAEAKWGLPKGLLDSVWSQESGRGRNMLSKAGAMGHFQFMPDTAKQYGLQDPNDLSQSADAAGHMYRDLLRKYRGNLPAALAAYNWGSGNVDKLGLDNAPLQTRNYTQSILAQMGRSPDDAVGVGSANISQVKHELFIKLEGLPAGTTATARKPDGSTIPVNVATSMAGP